MGERLTAASVRRVGEESWEEYREVRLAMLLDAPTAFAGTHEESAARGEEQWRKRLRDMPTWLARDADGLPMGAVSLHRFPAQDPDEACLIALWVTPAARGRGVGAALVATVLDEAAARGLRRVTLDVAEHNTVARRLYERLGFRPTGRRGVLPHDPQITEIELAREVGPLPAP